MPLGLGNLASLYHHTGPFATVCLDVGRTGEDAAQEIELRWRGLRGDLLCAGANDPTLRALDDVIGAKSGNPGEEGQFSVAADGQVLIDERLPQPPSRGLARWEPLPDVLPLLRGSGHHTPYVLVRVDHAGAQIDAHGPAPETDEHQDVHGADWPLHKVRSGGWSHKRIQQRAENQWRDNAREVADTVATAATRYRAQLVILTGDPHSRSLLRDALDGPPRASVVELDGAGDPEAGVEDALARHRRAADDRAGARLRQELGRSAAATQGIAGVVEAVRRAQARTLFCEGEPTVSLWIGPDPAAIGTTRDEARAFGVAEPVQVRTIPALVRALADTEGEIVLAEADSLGLRDGLGALLRYDDSSTGHAA